MGQTPATPAEVAGKATNPGVFGRGCWVATPATPARSAGGLGSPPPAVETVPCSRGKGGPVHRVAAGQDVRRSGVTRIVRVTISAMLGQSFATETQLQKTCARSGPVPPDGQGHLPRCVRIDFFTARTTFSSPRHVVLPRARWNN
jgi:hypothetical protein